MSKIQCPECGAKISDRATQCPHCGFQSVDPTRPISEQDSYEVVPTFEYDIEGWNPNGDDLRVISYEDNRNLVHFFANWDIIQTQFPAIAEVIGTMAGAEHIMIAKIDPYIQDLIDKGIYRFTIDKEGEILPTIRDAQGIVKQVRLEDVTLVPNLTQALNNLTTQAGMAQILSEIRYVGQSIQELHIELQNDRLAMAESAKDKLLQARLIQDTQLREAALLQVIHSATNAKRILMRNFSQNRHSIKEYSEKSDFEALFDRKGEQSASQKAIDAFQDLVHITTSVQIECEGYAMLGEYEPCKECLDEFKTFILDNKLNKRDTLLLLNENSSQKNIDVVDQFSDIANRIAAFNPSNALNGTVYEWLRIPQKGDCPDEPN